MLKVKDIQFAINYYYTSWTRPDQVSFLPSIIHIETTTKCNLACTICPRTFIMKNDVNHDRTGLNKDLSLDQYLKILDQFDSLHVIRLHGFGEPLMNPNLIDFVLAANSLDIKTEFTTNATLLSLDLAKSLIQSGLSEMTVSLDGATKNAYERIRTNARFETVIENLFQFTRVKSSLKKNQPFLRINMVVTTENITEICDLLKLAKEIGVKEFRASSIVPPHSHLLSLVPNEVLWNEETENAKTLARQLKINFICIYFNTKADDRKMKTDNKRRLKCSLPWIAPYIRLDGFVTPCCNTSDPNLLGNANIYSQDFSAIWNNEKFKGFRNSLKHGPIPEVCQKCPMR